jgi:carbamate kinase
VQGIEGIVDKDLSAALLAAELGADALLLLTDVPYVETGHGTARAAPIRHASPAELRAMRFERGSMGPKVEAACRFARVAGRIAAIGALTDAELLLSGRAGTQVSARTADDRGGAKQPDRQDQRGRTTAEKA